MYTTQKLDSFNNVELAELWSRFVHGENEIFSMSAFDEIYAGTVPSEIANLISCSAHFSTNDDYFIVDDTGSLESGTLLKMFDEVYDEDELADAIAPYEDDYHAMQGIEWPTDDEFVGDKLIAFVNDCAREGWDKPYRLADIVSAFSADTNGAYDDTVEFIVDGFDEEYADKADLIQAIEEA